MKTASRKELAEINRRLDALTTNVKSLESDLAQRLVGAEADLLEMQERNAVRREKRIRAANEKRAREQAMDRDYKHLVYDEETNQPIPRARTWEEAGELERQREERKAAQSLRESDARDKERELLNAQAEQAERMKWEGDAVHSPDDLLRPAARPSEPEPIRISGDGFAYVTPEGPENEVEEESFRMALDGGEPEWSGS